MPTCVVRKTWNVAPAVCRTYMIEYWRRSMYPSSTNRDNNPGSRSVVSHAKRQAGTAQHKHSFFVSRVASGQILTFRSLSVSLALFLSLDESTIKCVARKPWKGVVFYQSTTSYRWISNISLYWGNNVCRTHREHGVRSHAKHQAEKDRYKHSYDTKLQVFCFYQRVSKWTRRIEHS